MDHVAITHYITETFANVETAENFGYTFFFYSTDHMLPFATLISADNEYDRISQLDRSGVFRLNIGVRKETFQELFGSSPIDTSAYDFSELDLIMPHPEYAAQSFICVLNPGEATLQRVLELLAEAYQLAATRYHRRRAHERRDNI